jgi:membrane protein
MILLGPAVQWLLNFSPYLLITLLFIMLYVYMPNTKVHLSSAIVPAVLAGIAMQLLQLAYIHSQI